MWSFPGIPVSTVHPVVSRIFPAYKESTCMEPRSSVAWTHSESPINAPMTVSSAHVRLGINRHGTNQDMARKEETCKVDRSTGTRNHTDWPKHPSLLVSAPGPGYQMVEGNGTPRQSIRIHGNSLLMWRSVVHPPPLRGCYRDDHQPS